MLTEQQVAYIENVAGCSMSEVVYFAVQIALENEEVVAGHVTMARIVATWSGATNHSTWPVVKELLRAPEMAVHVLLYNAVLRYNGCGDYDDGPFDATLAEHVARKMRATRLWAQMIWLEGVTAMQPQKDYAFEFLCNHYQLDN